MRALAKEGLVVRDTLRFVEVTRRGTILAVNLRGRVETRSGAVLTVNKWLATTIRPDGRVAVLTSEYDYHAYVRFPRHQQNVFRYDNCHGPVETLHRHRYDFDGRPGEPVPIALPNMPPLNVIVREAEFYGRLLRGGDA